MFIKICPSCDKKSYSSSKKEEWVCPYCGEDLTNIKPKTPNNGRSD